MRAPLFVVIAVALVLPSLASAQFGGLMGGSQQAFTASINPQYPAPYSRATLSLVSSTLDLNRAVMAVSVAGKEIYRGNVQPLAIPLGATGSVTKVVVTIISAGANYSQTLSIQPQDVALIAEPISSAPPLYPGKSLVPLEGDVRMVAMANLRNAQGKVIDPATCSYAWTVDGAQIANASGIGRNSIIVASPLQYRSRDVSVEVASPDGNLVGGAEFSLIPVEPTVRIYENDPLLGIRYEHALSGTHAISTTEETLYAAPFSLPTTSGAPLVQWFLNGAMAQTGSTITLRPTGNGQGNASLSLTASAGAYTRATANLSLSFGATSGFNFFGL